MLNFSCYGGLILCLDFSFSFFFFNTFKQCVLSVSWGPVQRSSSPFLWGGYLHTSWWERLSRTTLNLCQNSTVTASAPAMLPRHCALANLSTSLLFSVCDEGGRLYGDPMTFKCNLQNFPDLPEWLRFTQRHQYDNGFLYGTPMSPGKSVIEVWCHPSHQKPDLFTLTFRLPKSRIQSFTSCFKRLTLSSSLVLLHL